MPSMSTRPYDAPRRVAPRLGLGTAQFGLDYGVANHSGKVADVEAVLRVGREAGIDLLDTAPAYGDAESRLGEFADGFEVITKTKASGDVDDVLPTLVASLERLRRPFVSGLLVHDRNALLGADGDSWFAALNAARDAGLTKRIGVSVYHPDEAELLLDRYPLQLVQLPISVLDQRAWHSGFLARATQKGVEVHARSLFLQGLALMDPDAVPDELAPARRPLAAFRARAAELGLTPLQAALGFVSALRDLDVMLVGVDSAEQLRQILFARVSSVRPSDFAEVGIEARELLDPSRWRLKR